VAAAKVAATAKILSLFGIVLSVKHTKERQSRYQGQRCTIEPCSARGGAAFLATSASALPPRRGSPSVMLSPVEWRQQPREIDPRALGLRARRTSAWRRSTTASRPRCSTVLNRTVSARKAPHSISARMGVSSSTANCRSTPLAVASARDASTASGTLSNVPYRHRAAPARAKSKTPTFPSSAPAPLSWPHDVYLRGDPYWGARSWSR